MDALRCFPARLTKTTRSVADGIPTEDRGNEFSCFHQHSTRNAGRPFRALLERSAWIPTDWLTWAFGHHVVPRSR